MPRKPGEKYREEQRLKRQREYNREYNKKRPERHEFYFSTAWRKLRAYKRSLNPLCEECLKEGRITKGELVDHIIPIDKGGELLNLDNLQTLCKACHYKKHKAEGRLKS